MIDVRFTDKICLVLDNALRAVAGHAHSTGRPTPAETLPHNSLPEKDRAHAAACMRINHAGEVAAQGLYHGQAFVSRTDAVREHLLDAAVEEGDHLNWCSQRLTELKSRPSLLAPFWYAGSFMIGSIAGLFGDRWSLGFVAETETQVMQHLEGHLSEINPADQRSGAILRQMHQDESEHRNTAIQAGAATLPFMIRALMRFSSNIMVKTAYWM